MDPFRGHILIEHDATPRASTRRHAPTALSVTGEAAGKPLLLSYGVMAGLAVLALAYRLLLFHTVLQGIDSDQSVSGLMSLHILQGERPIFFYGQGYNGALEQYLTALAFRLFGADDVTVRLAPAFLSSVLVAQLYLLARRLYSPGVALATGLWLALPPPVLLFWGTAAGAGYIPVTVLGTGMVMIAVRRWGLHAPRRYDLPALGLLAGLGVWAQPMIANYLATLALGALILAAPSLARRWRQEGFYRSTAWPAVAGVVLFVLGAAPWLGYTLQHRGASLDVLARPGASVSLPDLARRLLLQALPTLAGGAQPTGYADQFARYLAAHPLPYALTLAALCYLAARLLLSPRGLIAQARALLAGRPLPDLLLALLPLVVMALYLASRFKTLAWTTRNPRYLLPLYTALPYLVACMAPDATRVGERAERLATAGLVRLRAASRPLLAAGLAALLLVNVYGGLHYDEPPSGRLPSLAPLAATLLARGDGAVYADYWVAWRLAFESHERLAPVVILGMNIDHNPRGDRYPPEHVRAAHARRWAYIIPDRYVPRFVALLRRYHVPYQHWRWGSRDVFQNHWDWGRPNVFDGPVRPGVPFILSSAAWHIR